MPLIMNRFWYLLSVKFTIVRKKKFVIFCVDPVTPSIVRTSIRYQCAKKLWKVQRRNTFFSWFLVHRKGSFMNILFTHEAYACFAVRVFHLFWWVRVSSHIPHKNDNTRVFRFSCIHLINFEKVDQLEYKQKIIK